MKQNIDRWIFASFSTGLTDRINFTDLGLNFYIETEDRELTNSSNYVELRFNGPFYKEFTKNNFIIIVQINVLVNIIKDQSDNHKIFKACGLIEQALLPQMPIFKYGNGTDDDQSYLECMIRTMNGSHDLVTTHYGQISPDIRVLQSTVEAHYRMLLSIKEG